MKLVTLIVAVLFPCVAVAQTPAFAPDKQYSAEQTFTNAHGSHTFRTYFDDGKIRTEPMTATAVSTISIVRLDEGKLYVMMPSRKIAVVSPTNPAARQGIIMANTDNAKFELVGPDTINGVACAKYKETPQNGPVMLWWVSTADKTPVRVAAPDGTTKIDFKNYKAGPQDAALFEPPADYQQVQMQAKAPGGGAPSGGGPTQSGQ